MTSNITIVGNATRDVELRYLPNGTPIATFGVAVNRRWQDKQGEWQENVSFFDVTAWTDLGQNAADTIQKGTRVIVTGRLEQRSWETNEGERRSKVEIVATDIGPSLRWATAEVHRNQRSDDDPGGLRGSGSRAANEPPAAAYDPTEEPF